MTVLGFLQPAKPDKRLFLVVQDVLIYALVFVSGPVGVFVNMWSGGKMNCIPVLDCRLKPRGSERCNSGNGNGVIWQTIPLPMTTHLSNICLKKNELPSYVLYAYVVVFVGSLVLWLLHVSWMKVPLYERIAVLFGSLDREEREQVVKRLKVAVHREKDVAIGQNRTKGFPRGSIEIKDEESRAPLAADRISSTLAKLVKSLVKLLYRTDVPKLHRFFQCTNFIGMVLCAVGGYFIITHVLMVVEAPFPCDIQGNTGREILLPVNYTSIECSLLNENGAWILYLICAILALLIAAVKLGVMLYVTVKICCGYHINKCFDCNLFCGALWGARCGKKCAQDVGTDVHMLRLLLVEKQNDIPSDYTPTSVTVTEIDELSNDASRHLKQCVVRILADVLRLEPPVLEREEVQNNVDRFLHGRILKEINWFNSDQSVNDPAVKKRSSDIIPPKGKEGVGLLDDDRYDLPSHFDSRPLGAEGTSKKQ